MQAEALQLSSKPTQGQANNDLNTQLLNANQEKCNEWHDWLSDEFNRIPFRLYKCWLVLSIGIFIAIVFSIVCRIKKDEGTKDGNWLILAGFLIIVYGCGEMFWAMIIRKSKLAQQSLSKFSYGTTTLIVAFLFGFSLRSDPETFLFADYEENFKTFLYATNDGYLRFIILIIIQAPLHFGGAAVIRAFKNNHPLERQKNLEIGDDMESFGEDLIEQNKVIESETLKFDQKLNSCAYRALRYWLQFVVVYEMLIVVSNLLRVIGILPYFYHHGIIGVTILLGRISLILSSSLALYYCFEIEAAIQKKILVKSQRALIVLKIGLAISGISFLLDLIPILQGVYFLQLGIQLGIPIVTYIGAINVRKILEQRDKIAKFSNFHNASYL